jgi:predicted nucleic acid-binding protein
MPLEDRRDPDAPVTRSDLANVQRQLGAGDVRMTNIESELKKNTELTSDVKALLDAARVGLKVLGWIGMAAVWAAKIATAIGAVYGAWQLIKHGNPPK